ncbi:MAG: glycosyl hydrolase [Novosphingobium sp.]
MVWIKSGWKLPMRHLLNSAACAGLAASILLTNIALGREKPSLEESFRDPPQEARPQVWWHWLNGNVTKEGIRKDIEWMKRAGIGGAQTFDINFSTPTVVDKRLMYMTPAWKDAFRFATSEADRLGLDLTVAASPGWSQTGGPWVAPSDAMKKLVWSTTEVIGGSDRSIGLAPPPRVSGPFQDVPLTPEPGAEKTAVPQWYQDVAVLAFPSVEREALPLARFSTPDGQTLDSHRLSDGKYAESVSLARSGSESVVLIAFDGPQAVQTMNVFSTANTDPFNGSAFLAILESCDALGSWTKVTEFLPSLVPTTVSFPAVTASRFRLRLVPRENLSPVDGISAPGYAGINYTQFLRARPIQLAELRLLPEPRVNRSEEKAGFSIARDYYNLDEGQDAKQAGISRSSVVDLTGKLRADGSLDWVAPAGNWRIVRFGTSLLGKTNHPAPVEATGLEVDKLDGSAVRRYIDHYVKTYRDTVGRDFLGKRGVSAILTDSTEVGAFNWTPRMRAEFQKRRGYDPLLWLPTLSGEIVSTREESDRFLYDFRRTIAELHASEHYQTVAQVAHANDLKVYGEALEGWRVSLGDDIDMRAGADIPMGALWSYPSDIGPRPLLLADLRTAASTAHLYGKPIIAAESMTSSRFPWAHSPADLRRVIDTEFAQGVNRIVIHTSPHQPIDDKVPGLSLRHIGQFFTRHETWAEMARPWTEYIARSSFLLQQGRNVADVAYFLGEDGPAGSLAEADRLRDVPRRHAYDFVNATTILRQFRVQKGKLHTKGASYHALYLGGSSRQMTLPVLRRIEQLVRQGATVVGRKPTSSPSLADNQAAFGALARSMWSGKPATAIGKGRIIDSDDIEAALASISVLPDFSASPKLMEQVDFVHRQSAGGDIYFVRNRSQTAVKFDAEFRVSGKFPELWDAMTGQSKPMSYRSHGRTTRVPLVLPGESSSFIVFRAPAKAAAQIIPEPTFVPVKTIDGGWSVEFQAGRGAPEKLDMPTLAPLNENAEAGVRYFSGIATYRTNFALADQDVTGRPTMLDLGNVGDLAEVRVNGEIAGTVWTTPFELDISRFIRAGSNSLEVRVANLWHNRLVGDAQPGAQKIAWTTTPMYKADAPLRPAGLIGPVTLEQVEK